MSAGEIRPVYLRQPDAQINWASRATGEGRRLDEHARPVPRARRRRRGSSSSRCAAATSPGCWRSSAASYPKPWTTTVFHDELDQVGTGHRHYLVARQGRSVVGYGGLMFVARRGPRHEHRRAPRPPAAPGSPPGCSATSPASPSPVAARPGRWRCGPAASGAQALYRSFGFAPAGIRTRYYEGTEDAVVMWCHDIQSPEYAARLAGLRRDVMTDDDVLAERRAGHARARHRDELRRDGGGARDGRQRRRCRASSARRSTSTCRTAAWCRRSPAAPTSTCSTRSSPGPSSRPGSRIGASTPSPARSARA